MYINIYICILYGEKYFSIQVIFLDYKLPKAHPCERAPLAGCRAEPGGSACGTLTPHPPVRESRISRYIVTIFILSFNFPLLTCIKSLSFFRIEFDF